MLLPRRRRRRGSVARAAGLRVKDDPQVVGHGVERPAGGEAAAAVSASSPQQRRVWGVTVANLQIVTVA